LGDLSGDDDADDDNKPVWPTWAVGDFSGERDVKGIQPHITLHRGFLAAVRVAVSLRR
jgi:hypothetical protein